MNKNTLLALAAVTLAGVGVATFSRRDTHSASDGGAQRPLFPGLEERVNDVARITLQKGDKSLTVERKGEEWTLPERGGYPAKFSEAKKIAVRVARLRVEEEKTAKPSNHARLGVEWPQATEPDDDGSGTEPALVTLFDAKGGELASLVVGKSEWRGGAQQLFVRPAASDQVVLVEGPLDVVCEVKTWIEPKILDVARDRVQSVKITHADGEVVDIGRSAQNHTDFKVQNVPPGQAERYDGVANGVGGVLASLQMEDVRPVGEVDFSAEPRARSVFRTIDGMLLSIESARFEDKTWIKVACTYEAPPEPAPPADEEDEGDEDQAEDATAKPDVAKETEELAARLAPWAFAIAEYKADPLAKHMKDLLAAPSEPGGSADLDPPSDGDEATDLFESFMAQHPDLAPEADVSPEADPAQEPAPEEEIKQDQPGDDEKPVPPQTPPVPEDG